MITSTPPLTPMAKLNGSKCSAKVGAYSSNMSTPAILRMADGTPRGRSLDLLSSESFSNAIPDKFGE
jgi:hypothetical protein